MILDMPMYQSGFETPPSNPVQQVQNESVINKWCCVYVQVCYNKLQQLLRHV